MMWVTFYAMILFDTTPNVANAESSRTCFRGNRQGCSCKICGRYNVSAIKLSRRFRAFKTLFRTACIKCDDLAKSTRSKVEKTLAATDASDLRASFRRALSLSIPPQILYSNYRLGGPFSQLIFGVPLIDFRAKQGKVMRMCIEEVEKRGLNTHKIYSVS